ncbi:unnamed protein product [Wickerhamomyces anomalus]
MEKRPSTEPQNPEKPGSASDHNNSMITAVSADRDTEKSSSPVTSPMIHRREIMGVNKNAETRFNDAVSSKSKELISLMNEIVQMTELKDQTLQNFVDEQGRKYSEKEELLIWQESAYILDSEKVAKRLGNQEEWINSKEAYLNHTRNELVKSAQLIDNAIKNLKQDDGNKSEKPTR